MFCNVLERSTQISCLIDSTIVAAGKASVLRRDTVWSHSRTEAFPANVSLYKEGFGTTNYPDDVEYQLLLDNHKNIRQVNHI
jgi:hypothetical protein